MTYAIKEIFYSLQGEGAHSGRPAVFCRFAGCNLWSGREADRATATCRFCDTDFVGTDGAGGGKFDRAAALAAAIERAWAAPLDATVRASAAPERAIASASPAPATARASASAPPRTAGPSPGGGATRLAPAASRAGAGHRFVVLTGGEPLLQVDDALLDALHARGFMVAVETNGTIAAPAALDWICVSPKAGAPLVVTAGDELKAVVPQPGLDLAALADLAFSHFFVQPMDGPLREANTLWAIDWCLHHPRWRLSLQTHKIVGIR